MRKFGWVAWLVGGLLLGGISTALLMGATPLPSGQERPTAALERLTTKALGDALMPGVTSTFVADSRASKPATHGVTFFDQPTPAGDFLCLVRTYRVPAEVVSGRRAYRHEGALETGEAYGLWIDPFEAGKTDRDRLRSAAIRACARFRDFEHLISEKDPLAATGGLEFLSAAKAAAREDRTSAGLSCLSRREEQSGLPCDALAYLRALDLKSVRFVETIADHVREERASSWPAAYRLTVDDGEIDGHPALTSITVRGRHAPGMRVHSVDEVTIVRDVL